ncbi:P-loop containing nucleoside triphosphate hydrolase protein [Umbelopsis sp. AD052]|nr:P-loop containing nucleoside triphosphate hydrolase protein [Umbelopsis sp. AD052]
MEEDEKWLLTEEKLLEQQNQMPSIPAAYKAVTSHEPIGLSKSHLTPVMSLPPNFRLLFPYTHFNRFQSECIDEVYRADENLVVSAPTGSGKTVLLELAILRTLHQEGCHKAIYIAPTKALSSQRANDWIRKFSHLNLTCQELTGDTEYVSFEYIKKCDIIVTTPEKWDSMTRRWTEHRKLMSQMTLCLIDEVHLVGQTRGATLEACISRMKMAVSNQRIIALSATVPNIQDVARWLNAKPLCFGEEYRPVKLSRHVYGIHDSGGNPFMFEKKLEWKLVDMIQKHSGGKPTLIFCSTRKSTQSSCDVIIKVMKQRNIPFFGNVLKPVPKTKDKKLFEYLSYGIAFHHAGLDAGDRQIVERLFLAGHLNIIATTLTLSVGVNLPAHLVIIKSTRGYAEGKFQEYSDLEVYQMIGRAGRPGFDDSGCAVILTTTTQQRKYETMLSGQEVLESTLHQNMIEHLNAEICLGTICDTPSGISWLRSTFLYVRVQKNSFYYKLGEDAASVVNVERILENICLKHLSALASSDIIQLKPDEDQISSTKYGEAMARYYIKYDTMKIILSSQPQLQLASMFELLTSAREFDDIRFTAGEKSVLNNLNKHPNIRYPIKGKVSTISDKIYLLTQAILGGIPLNDSKLAAVHSREIFRIHHQALRVLRCHLLQQLEGIGPQYAKILADSGIQTFGDLKSCDPRRLEMLLHRNPPFGSQLLEATNKIPQFKLSAKPSLQGGQCKSIEASIEIVHQSSKRPVYSNNSFAAFWATTNLDELLDYRRIQLRKLEKLVTIPIDLPEGWHPTTIKCSVNNEEYDDEFDFDSPYWNNIPDELWEGLNVEASASSTQLNKSNPKRLSQFHDGARETCQHKCKDRQLCAHECCKIGKRRKGKSAISKAGNSSMNNPLSTASNLLPSAFETEQLHLPQRYNRLPNSTIQKLSSELYNGPLDHSSGQSENGAESIKPKESPIRQDVVSNANSSSKHAQEDGGPFSACDPILEPSSVHSESMNSSNVVELSAYSFENPDISLMEFDDYSTVLEQTGSVLHTEVSSTDLDYPRRISKQANEKIESNEFMAFQKWLEECVDVIAD